MNLNNETGDRRKEQRYEICIEAKVITSENSYIGAVKNISGGGMEIQMSKSVNPKTELTVSFQLHEEFVFHGKIVWTLGDYINKRWVYRIGFNTEDIHFKNETVSTAPAKRDLIQEILPYIKKMGTLEIVKIQNAA